MFFILNHGFRPWTFAPWEIPLIYGSFCFTRFGFNGYILTFCSRYELAFQGISGVCDLVSANIAV